MSNFVKDEPSLGAEQTPRLGSQVDDMKKAEG